MQISNLSVYRNYSGVRGGSQPSEPVERATRSSVVASTQKRPAPAEYIMEGEVLGRKREKQANPPHEEFLTSSPSAQQANASTYQARDLHIADLAIAAYQSHAQLAYKPAAQLFDAFA